MKSLHVVLMMLSLVDMAHANPLDDSIVQAAFPGCTKTHCYIGYNGGGNLWRFLSAADIMGREHYHVMIGGPVCASACAAAADELRGNGADVCVLPSVSFYFHKATLQAQIGGIPAGTRFNPPESPQITRYIKQKGGFPLSNSIQGMLRMPIEDAVRYWRQCEPSEVP